ncbi:hypothetical protein HFN65_00025 [Rhizobium laguerreae]|uniref:LuxR C-terminal-related transcriptional regulator n=2 Tax=Rhizobium/Agrobacterium group TaxID=227290 RepID=UPI000E0E5290|nr:LuxR C-terminal-related transcriptional regulator [Rhizobium leguminosarum]MBY2943246.1 hypothetical protein [Rhizobium leguminosarum]MBY3496954.1 hypothetical protein [Rhizobium laguerreae]MBY3569416.1 hypothetical protein [Rhizobium laguerreae]NKL34949.1 hypothetical protein [Rhizobium leguminosarum bv. viciae]
MALWLAVLTTKNTVRQMPARRQYWRQPEIFLFRPFAEELKLSRRTVEAHRARMMRSTGIRNAVELMAWFSTEMN